MIFDLTCHGRKVVEEVVAAMNILQKLNAKQSTLPPLKENGE